MYIINWLIPTLIKGSGGHRTMLQHAKALEQDGHVCRIYLERGDEEASKHIFDMFGYDFKHVFLGWDNISDCDVCIATIWYSADVVRKLEQDCHKIYFVQDYEAWFNPVGSAYLAAEHSYSLGLTPLTIGRWLSAKLANQYGSKALSFDFGADLNQYHAGGKISQPQICFIFQPEKPRRCWELGIEALTIVQIVRPDAKIVLFGSKKSNSPSIPKSFHHAGLLDISSCSELYRRSRVGLCLSATNPSRIPFEMMASGLPLVEIHGENTVYDLPDKGVILADRQPEDIAAAILEYLEDDALYNCKRDAALQFMSNRTHDTETTMFRRHVNAILDKSTTDQKCHTPLYSLGPFTCSDAQLERITRAKASQSAEQKRALRKRKPASARFKKIRKQIFG